MTVAPIRLHLYRMAVQEKPEAVEHLDIKTILALPLACCLPP